MCVVFGDYVCSFSGCACSFGDCVCSYGGSVCILVFFGCRNIWLDGDWAFGASSGDMIVFIFSVREKEEEKEMYEDVCWFSDSEKGG